MPPTWTLHVPDPDYHDTDGADYPPPGLRWCSLWGPRGPCHPSIEGTATEWLLIAGAIEAGAPRAFDRVGFEPFPAGGRLWSPRNSMGERDHVTLTAAELLDLAKSIRDQLAPPATSPGSRPPGVPTSAPPRFAMVDATDVRGRPACYFGAHDRALADRWARRCNDMPSRFETDAPDDARPGDVAVVDTAPQPPTYDHNGDPNGPACSCQPGKLDPECIHQAEKDARDADAIVGVLHRGFLPALRSAIDRLAPAVSRHPVVPMLDLGPVDAALARLRVTVDPEYGVGYTVDQDAIRAVVGSMPAIVAELREMRARGPRSTKLEDAVERDQPRSEIGGLRVQLDFAKRETALDQARAKADRARRDGEGHGFEAGWRARGDAGPTPAGGALAAAKAEYRQAGGDPRDAKLTALAARWRQGSLDGDDTTAANCADQLEALLAGER